MAASPVDQFRVKPLFELEVGGLDLSFTNSALWMVIAVAVATLVMTLGTRRAKIVPGYAQVIAESLYDVIHNMVRDNVGKLGEPFFPAILSLFLLILFGNTLGLIPGSFTFTSHLIVTVTLALTVFIVVTMLGLIRHGLAFFKLFLPEGTPIFVAPLIIPIEIISYLSRPFSLSVRLFANMVVGHVLLKVIAGFILLLGLFGFAPFLVLVAITALEVFVAVIQAYVFAILTCIYLNDALNLH